MKIIDVVDGSAPLGSRCAVCNKTIGVPDKVLEFGSYDDMWNCYICKKCMGEAYEKLFLRPGIVTGKL